MGDGKTTIDIVHNMIHEGQSFYACYESAQMSNTNVVDILLVAPGDRRCHIVGTYEVFGGTAKLEVFEGATVSALGTEKTTQPRNRARKKISGLKQYLTPTVTSTGQLMRERTIRGATSAAARNVSANRGQNETVLSPGTIYLIRFTAQDNSIFCSAFWEWYEE